MPAVLKQSTSMEVVYPNRDKTANRATKMGVTLILVASVAVMLAVTIGGWSELEGMTPVNVIWSLVYLVIAFYVQRRWTRGLLPIAAALAILLLLISLISGIGIAGPSWFDRSGRGFAAADSLFGGRGLSADTLGLLTLLLAPLQVMLVFFAMRGFAQNWNVEVERPAGAGAHGHDG